MLGAQVDGTRAAVVVNRLKRHLSFVYLQVQLLVVHGHHGVWGHGRQNFEARKAGPFAHWGTVRRVMVKDGRLVLLPWKDGRGSGLAG